MIQSLPVKILVLLLALGLGYSVYQDFGRGEVRLKRRTYRRADSSFAFWFYQLIFSLMALGMLIAVFAA